MSRTETKLEQPKAQAPEFAPVTFESLKEEISYDDFARLDFRVGKILAAERVPKADKLLRFDVDLGFEQRQVVSGIAQQFRPEELVGKTVVVVANLAPRKIRGLESRGMILLAEAPDGFIVQGIVSERQDTSAWADPTMTITKETYTFLSSRITKEIARLGGDVGFGLRLRMRAEHPTRAAEMAGSLAFDRPTRCR